MLNLTLELIFLTLLLISLYKAHFSNNLKLIVFSVYIVLGILTKTIWFPVLVWVVMWFYFTRQYSETDGDD
jgi:hypothetical protein